MTDRLIAGFTLLEVMIGIAVGGLVVTGAHLVLTQIADSSEKIVAIAANTDSEANGERLLRSLVRQLSVGDESETRFRGTHRAVRFRSWCVKGTGWLEPCDVTLGFVDVNGGQAFAALLDRDELIVLRRDFARGELRYIDHDAEEVLWIRSWDEAVSTPAAIGVIIDRDTLILRIGVRG